ncbi:hypothetical protein Pcinc_000851 [Petrolisthes cinctipes]|uniref:Uncharacterized protein n=1 Tax=Petrolisthes cinctipes TaxID=88211 RepID=A0AAE1GMF9_PETCI|nr:hypothetical protein Pcinc_000851 [Petrolisthes cinctipes]
MVSDKGMVVVVAGMVSVQSMVVVVVAGMVSNKGMVVVLVASMVSDKGMVVVLVAGMVSVQGMVVVLVAGIVSDKGMVVVVAGMVSVQGMVVVAGMVSDKGMVVVVAAGMVSDKGMVVASMVSDKGMVTGMVVVVVAGMVSDKGMVVVVGMVSDKGMVVVVVVGMVSDKGMVVGMVSDKGMVVVMADNGQAEVKAIICAILAHLHDKEEFLYVCVKPTTAKTAVEKNLPQTPCLIGFGESKLSATRYMLSVDGVVVNDHIATFTSGLAVLFASYYNLNILYPVEAATTLEFIQRCFVGINPDRGSRIEIKKSGKKHSQAHPKVLSLINAIVDAEWRS